RSGTKVFDSVSNNFGTVSGVYSFIDGVSGTGLNLSTGRISLNNPVSAPELTISVWHRYNATQGSTGWRTIFGTAANVHPLILRSQTEISFFGGIAHYTGVHIPNDGKYHHVVITFSSNIAKIYLDGSLISTAFHGFNFTTNPITVVGNGGAQNYPSGDNDEFKIFN